MRYIEYFLGQPIKEWEGDSLVKSWEYDFDGRVLYRNDYKKMYYEEFRYNDKGLCCYKKFTNGNNGEDIIELFIDYHENGEFKTIKTSNHKTYYYNENGLPIK